MSKSRIKFQNTSLFFYRKYYEKLPYEKKFNKLTKLGVFRKRITPYMLKNRWKFTGSKRLKQYKLVNRSVVITKRSNFIDKFLKNHKFRIHKGLYSNLMKITEVHIGYKIGEFSITRKAFNYPIIKKDGKITKRL